MPYSSSPPTTSFAFHASVNLRSRSAFEGRRGLKEKRPLERVLRAASRDEVVYGEVNLD